MRLFAYFLTALFIITTTAFKGSTPQINQKIVEYIDQVKGKKVDRGECWDLAAGALAYAGGYLDRSNARKLYIFGEKINPKKDQVYPGDIIQFENITLEYEEGNTIYTETMSHHTAIVYEVHGDGLFSIAHQNTSEFGKKVGISDLNLNHIQKGKYIFYRPIPDK
ncbi:MAG TPA: hypothetical protein DDY13_16165 [Cytophagales bacterium]|jgi:hypothetical protein|nr:hypothetical protein [Cytophagales bacterium]